MNAITPLDYFAAHAPHEIPAWFVWPEYPDKPTPPAHPEKPAGASEEDWRQAQNLAHHVVGEGLDYPDDAGPLFHACAAFRERLREWNKAHKEWERENAAERYFAWRVHYAKQMVSELGIARAGKPPAAADQGEPPY